MTRKRKRTQDFEIDLTIRNEDFIRPPRDTQRNWLLNGALNEVADNLASLDRLAKRFVPGASGWRGEDRRQAVLADDEIMESWQIPLMQAMAEVACASHGDILEVGFGRGISADFIQQQGVRSHTVIECNDDIVGRFHHWRERHPHSDIHLAHGLWQDVLGGLGNFDGVFFHTYPLDQAEAIEQIGGSVTFAEHFFAHAAAHLNEGGVFTYLSNEMDSLSRSHQRRLFAHFREITMQVVRDLQLPEDVADAWWADSMIVVGATR